MKRIMGLVVIGLLVCSLAFAGESIYERNRPDEVDGWHICVVDDDVDAAYELLTILDTTYTQLSADAKVELFSSIATTATVTVAGVNSDGDLVSEDLTLTQATLATSTTTFSFVDQVKASAGAPHTLIIRKADDTFVTSIATGDLVAGMAQHFNGDKIAYLSYWDCGVITTDASVTFQLRLYPNDASSRAPTSGFEILDTGFITVTAGTVSFPKIYPQPIEIPAGNWLAVYGKGTVANANAYTVIQGVNVYR